MKIVGRQAVHILIPLHEKIKLIYKQPNINHKDIISLLKKQIIDIAFIKDEFFIKYQEAIINIDNFSKLIEIIKKENVIIRTKVIYKEKKIYIDKKQRRPISKIIDEQYIDAVISIASLNVRELSKWLNVSVTTLYKFKKNNPHIHEKAKTFLKYYKILKRLNETFYMILDFKGDFNQSKPQ